jgi:hypothetical protein
MRISARLVFIVLIITFPFGANLTFSQIKFGPQVGLNFSKMPNNTKYIVGDAGAYNGFNAGVIADFKISEHLFLQPGLSISTRGSKYVVGNDTISGSTGFSDFQFVCYYADLPLNLVYKINQGPLKILLILGPQLGYGLAGNWTTSYGTESKVHFGNDPEDDLKPFDYGINAGAGVEFGRIRFSAQYYLGLKSLSTLTPPANEQKFRIFTISGAYLFGNDKRIRGDYESRFYRKYNHNKAHK